jgi:hypothetical protein
MKVSLYICVFRCSSSPPTPSSFTHAHKCIGTRNPNWHSVSNSVRLTYLSVHDSRDDTSESEDTTSEIIEREKNYVYFEQHSYL